MNTKIYCRIEARVIGVGLVGPIKSIEVSKTLATKLTTESPEMLSLKPFEIKENNKEEVKNA